MGPFIETLEATKKVTVSLVLPMVGLLMKALDPATPIQVKDYSDINNPVTIQVNVRLLLDLNLPIHLLTSSALFNRGTR